MINWKNSKKQLPINGSWVWTVRQHNKEHNPKSCELMCGEVSYGCDGSVIVESWDFTGAGNWSVVLRYCNETYKEQGQDYQDYCGDYALAWCYDHELTMPSWIPHDEHWDEY